MILSERLKYALPEYLCFLHIKNLEFEENMREGLYYRVVTIFVMCRL